jgi:hypothetical protein
MGDRPRKSGSDVLAKGARSGNGRREIVGRTTRPGAQCFQGSLLSTVGSVEGRGAVEGKAVVDAPDDAEPLDCGTRTISSDSASRSATTHRDDAT